LRLLIVINCRTCQRRLATTPTRIVLYSSLLAAVHVRTPNDMGAIYRYLILVKYTEPNKPQAAFNERQQDFTPWRPCRCSIHPCKTTPPVVPKKPSLEPWKTSTIPIAVICLSALCVPFLDFFYTRRNQFPFFVFVRRTQPIPLHLCPLHLQLLYKASMEKRKVRMQKRGRVVYRSTLGAFWCVLTAQQLLAN